MTVVQETSIEQMEKLGMLKAEEEGGKTLLGRNVSGDAALKPRKASFMDQLKYLTERELKCYVRNKPVIAINLFLAVFLNLIFGVIFYQAGNQTFAVYSNVVNASGAATLVCINALFGPAEAALFQFPKERPIFLREFASGNYNVVSYFLAKLLVELPATGMNIMAGFLTIYWLVGFHGNFGLMFLTLWLMAMASSSLGILLGCATTNTEQATQLFPLIAVPQIMFTGVFISIEAIPVWVRWIQYLCPLKYAVNLLLIVQFKPSACTFACDDNDGACITAAEDNCAAVKRMIDINVDEKGMYVGILFALFILYRMWGLVLLRAKAKTVY